MALTHGTVTTCATGARMDGAAANYSEPGIDATTLLRPEEDEEAANAVLTLHAGREVGRGVPLPAPVVAKHRACSEVDEELLVRLIARSWVRTGRQPDYSWEFWRGLHDRYHACTLVGTRSLAGWQTRWLLRQHDLLPRVQEHHRNGIDGEHLIAAERGQGVTQSGMRIRLGGVDAGWLPTVLASSPVAFL